MRPILGISLHQQFCIATEMIRRKTGNVLLSARNRLQMHHLLHRRNRGPKRRKVRHQKPMPGRDRRDSPGIYQFPGDHIRKRLRRSHFVKGSDHIALENLPVHNRERREKLLRPGQNPFSEFTPIKWSNLFCSSRLTQALDRPRGQRAVNPVLRSSQACRHARW